MVVDPFAGGGSIPLEALRLGCEAFASDLNPVACLILKVMLEDIPRRGPGLADELRRVGAEIKAKAEVELADLYPKDADGATPIAYLWARTVRCEAPNCGAEIPLMRSFWLCKKPKRKRALRVLPTHPGAPSLGVQASSLPAGKMPALPGQAWTVGAICPISKVFDRPASPFACTIASLPNCAPHGPPSLSACDSERELQRRKLSKRRSMTATAPVLSWPIPTSPGWSSRAQLQRFDSERYRLHADVCDAQPRARSGNAPRSAQPVRHRPFLEIVHRQ